jgi:PAS domain S-box-containing protein
MPRSILPFGSAAALRHDAERRLKHRRPKLRPASVSGAPRLLQELQVHQIELEVQNAELADARDRLEILLDKYTDLYDFAPVGYFTLDEQGRIVEMNLTSAVLLGIERSRLRGQPLQRFVAPASRRAFEAFLEQVFAGRVKRMAEMALLTAKGATWWANLQAMPTIALPGAGKTCRVAILDVTARKRADEAQRRAEALAATNSKLQREIVRRQAVEASLRKSERHQRQLLADSRRLQTQLRSLSHRVLEAQEDERKRISRELHDEVVQSLVGINVHLGALGQGPVVDPRKLKRRIARTQRLIRQSVDVVHRFARDLRPTLLDDLGLIPALHAYLKEFSRRSNARVHFTAAAVVEAMGITRRTVLYRVAQSALANVAQHAHASEVTVSIRRLKGCMRLEVHDNGRSFDVAAVLHAKRHKRLGVVGMRERVEMVGGCFSVTSAPGKGTTVRAEIPFEQESRTS